MIITGNKCICCNFIVVSIISLYVMYTLYCQKKKELKKGLLQYVALQNSEIIKLQDHLISFETTPQ